MPGLYLHIPFCERKCIYCDFYSIENLKPIHQFVSVLEKEIASYGSYKSDKPFDTIFFGGGTPSLLTPAEFDSILNTLHRNFTIANNVELTVETNPGTVDAAKLKDYLALGINRLSFGVQSFYKDELEFLGRIHSIEQAKDCVKIAQDIGFQNINIDLIFALPNQTKAKWESTLEQAVALQTQHLSAYSLIVEPQTPLYRMVESKQVSVLPTEQEAEFYESTMAFMQAKGFEQYEVSNYAKPGFRSKHNYHYWTHEPYLGFGPSAHSYWEGRRWWNVKNLQTYFERISGDKLPVDSEEFLTPEQLFHEYVMLGLRSDGLRLGEISSRFGIDLMKSHKIAINEYIADGLGEYSNGVFRLTGKGYLVCDSIAGELISYPVAA